MPSKPKPKPKPRQQPTGLEVVSPIWLLKAIGMVILAAIICGYLSLCLLFYQGQWQLVLHPTHSSDKPQPTQNLIRFGPDETALPQLTGLWIPSDSAARYATTTILFLPSGDGSLADAKPTLDRLHNLGLNVFAFDYRGYGFSAATNPNNLRMSQDAESAWQYLTTSRAIPASHIIPYGTGVGASLAAALAATHPEVPALILDAPQTDLLPIVQRDKRARLLPASLLFHEHFPMTTALESLPTPKLLLSTSSTPAYKSAASPKMTVELNHPTALLGNDALYTQTLTRFLDQYLAQHLQAPNPQAPALP